MKILEVSGYSFIFSHPFLAEPRKAQVSQKVENSDFPEILATTMNFDANYEFERIFAKIETFDPFRAKKCVFWPFFPKNGFFQSFGGLAYSFPISTVWRRFAVGGWVVPQNSASYGKNSAKVRFFGLFQQKRRISESFHPIRLKFEHNLPLTILYLQKFFQTHTYFTLRFVASALNRDFPLYIADLEFFPNFPARSGNLFFFFS